MLSNVELREITDALEAISALKNREVSFQFKVTIFDSAGEECGTIENYKDDGDETAFFYPKTGD